MIRTQVYLPEELYGHIQLLARQDRKVSAQVIRELLTTGLKKVVEEKKTNAGDALLRLAKIGAQGPKDLSINHDKYLYG
ncbi:hypothetical protein HY949_02705 [Candidatus Gottesmanbacteria bacterium]|nr:hypothetical protein [Candidatus Gottesmanbacteria bacterium]